MRRQRWLVLLAMHGLACSGGAPLSGAVERAALTQADEASPSGNDGVGSATTNNSVTLRVSEDERKAALAYWTPERMAAATPVPQEETGVGSKSARAESSGRAGAEPGEDGIVVAEPSPAEGIHADATTTAAIPVLGAIFHTGPGGSHYCTASVVTSARQNLIITAAHCIHGGKGKTWIGNFVFVPQYHDNLRPLGIWAPSTLTVDRRWIDKSDADLDFGFATLSPNEGVPIQHYTGSNGIMINQGWGKTVRVSGYPNGALKPITCSKATERVPGMPYQLGFPCTDYANGTSGSPWVLSYNSQTHLGYVNAVLGGKDEGGAHTYYSYASYFDQDVWSLYQHALTLQ